MSAILLSFVFKIGEIVWLYFSENWQNCVKIMNSDILEKNCDMIFFAISPELSKGISQLRGCLGTPWPPGWFI